MANNPVYYRPSNDQGQDDAGDASASLYKNEQTMDEGAKQPVSSLRPGENVDDLRAAEHGDPDKDVDLENEETFKPQQKPIK